MAIVLCWIFPSHPFRFCLNYVYVCQTVRTTFSSPDKPLSLLTPHFRKPLCEYEWPCIQSIGKGRMYICQHGVLLFCIKCADSLATLGHCLWPNTESTVSLQPSEGSLKERNSNPSQPNTFIKEKKSWIIRKENIKNKRHIQHQNNFFVIRFYRDKIALKLLNAYIQFLILPHRELYPEWHCISKHPTTGKVRPTQVNKRRCSKPCVLSPTWLKEVLWMEPQSWDLP